MSLIFISRNNKSGCDKTDRWSQEKSKCAQQWKHICVIRFQRWATVSVTALRSKSTHLYLSFIFYICFALEGFFKIHWALASYKRCICTLKRTYNNSFHGEKERDRYRDRDRKIQTDKEGEKNLSDIMSKRDFFPLHEQFSSSHIDCCIWIRLF